MNKYLALTLFLTAVFATPAFSQSTNKDSIRIERKVFSNLRYYQGEKKLTMPEVTNLLSSNTEAAAYWKKGKTNTTLAYIFGIIGGAMVGYELGRSLGGGGKVNGAVLGIGGGLIGVSIVFSLSGDRNAKKAINRYNTSFR